MVSKTRRTTIEKSNLENDSFQVNETPIEPARNVNTNDVLADIDINTIIRQAVQNEVKQIWRYWSANSESVTDRRVTHEVAENSKVDLNRSTRNDCPGPSVLAQKAVDSITRVKPVENYTKSEGREDLSPRFGLYPRENYVQNSNDGYPSEEITPRNGLPHR